MNGAKRKTKRSATEPLDARRAAFSAILDALRGRGFVADKLSTLRAAGRLSPQDASLAMHLALGVVRHARTLRHIVCAVGDYEPHRVAPALRAIVALGAFQLIYSDHVPAYAAVHETVELARRVVGGRSPAMANALLRRVSEAIETHRAAWQRGAARHVRVGWATACVFRRPVLPILEIPSSEVHLSAATGLGLERYRQLIHRHGIRFAEQIAWASQAEPPFVLQRNPLKADAAAFEAAVRAVAISDPGKPGDPRVRLDFAPDAAFVIGGDLLLHSDVLRNGLAYVQDTTAHETALLIRPFPGQSVLDLCAAPGGKAAAIAIAMGDRGEVVACDVSSQRLEAVRENAHRLGLHCIRTQLVSNEPQKKPQPESTFDAAIVDVPCSNTGVLARRPEAGHSLTASKLRSLAALQARLLAAAAERVRLGGVLVYSTCSIEPEENDEHIMAFLRRNTGWRLDERRLFLPRWGACPSDWRDGGFAARLVRTE